MSEAHSRESNTATKKMYISIAASSSSSLSPLAIQNYFAQYDEIEFVSYHSDCGYTVQFKNSVSTAAIINNDHNIGGIMIKAWVNETDLLVPPATDSPWNILNKLNDDCLIEIFEYLSLSNLCAVADVCTKFKSNAVQVFTRFFSDFDIKMLDDDDDEIDEQSTDNTFPMDSVERVFRNFGLFIKNINIDQVHFDEEDMDKILEFMAIFCSSRVAVLNKLVMCDITISNDLIQRLRPIFERLKFLSITGGSYHDDHAPLFKACRQLTEFILEDVNFTICFMQKFENLRRIALDCVSFNCEVPLFQCFLLMNPQLKTLTITESYGLSSDIYPTIGCLQELEELKLHINMNMERNLGEQLNHLARLKSLNVLGINCLSLMVSKLLDKFAEEKVPLEDLELTNLTLDLDIVKSLSKLSLMKNLRFSDCEMKSGQLANAVKGMLHLNKLYLCNFLQVTVNDIKQILKSARNLNELHLFNQNGIVIDAKDFSNISQLIENRGNNIKLKMYIIGRQCKLNVPENVIARKRLWLDVQVITFKDDDVVADILSYYSDSDDDSYNDS